MTYTITRHDIKADWYRLCVRKKALAKALGYKSPAILEKLIKQHDEKFISIFGNDPVAMRHRFDVLSIREAKLACILSLRSNEAAVRDNITKAARDWEKKSVSYDADELAAMWKWYAEKKTIDVNDIFKRYWMERP